MGWGWGGSCGGGILSQGPAGIVATPGREGQVRDHIPQPAAARAGAAAAAAEQAAAVPDGFVAVPPTHPHPPNPLAGGGAISLGSPVPSEIPWWYTQMVNNFAAAQNPSGMMRSFQLQAATAMQQVEAQQAATAGGGVGVGVGALGGGAEHANPLSGTDHHTLGGGFGGAAGG